MPVNEPVYGSMHRDFQSFAGPGDRDLPMSEARAMQHVTRTSTKSPSHT